MSKQRSKARDIEIHTAEEQPQRDDEQPTVETEPVDQAAAEPTETPSAEVDPQQRRIDELTDQLKRLAAEFDNYRKRTEREKAESADWGRIDLLKALFPAIDGLSRAVRAAQGLNEAWAEGLRSLERQLFNILEAEGLCRIPVEGKLDPRMHEVLSAVPLPGAEPDSIIECCEPGYTFCGRLVRPARVVVARTPAELGSEGSTEPN